MNEISIKIHEENDLYNPFDPDRIMFSDSVTAYILRKYHEIERSDQYCINIISDLPVDEERVRENFRTNMINEQHVQSREHHLSTLKQIRLFIIGIAFIAAWLFTRSNHRIFVEILSIIGSFAVYEAANIWISEKPYIRAVKLRLKKLEDTEIRFTVNESK